jgi:hypothetical protein
MVVVTVSERISVRCGEAVEPSTQYGPSVVEMPLLHAVPSLLLDVVDVPVLLELELLEDDELLAEEEEALLVVTGVLPAPHPARLAILARLISRTASRREKSFWAKAPLRRRIAARISAGTMPMRIRGSWS